MRLARCDWSCTAKVVSADQPLWPSGRGSPTKSPCLNWEMAFTFWMGRTPVCCACFRKLLGAPTRRIVR